MLAPRTPKCGIRKERTCISSLAPPGHFRNTTASAGKPAYGRCDVATLLVSRSSESRPAVIRAATRNRPWAVLSARLLPPVRKAASSWSPNKTVELDDPGSSAALAAGLPQSLAGSRLMWTSTRWVDFLLMSRSRSRGALLPVLRPIPNRRCHPDGSDRRPPQQENHRGSAASRRGLALLA